ncbi:MAG: von Willebrand factor type A domain-containing protein [Gemmatimonadales bacterium]
MWTHLVGSVRRSLVVLAAAIIIPATGPDQTATVIGTVRDTSGTAVAHAQIVITGTALAAMADDSGRYRIAGVPAGRVRLRAAAIGYAAGTVDTVAADGRTTTVDFRLTRSPVRIDEITVAGNPAPLVPRDEVTAAQAVRGVRASAGYVGAGFTGRRESTTFEQASVTGSASFGNAQSGIVSPSAQPGPEARGGRGDPDGRWNREQYARIYDNRFLDAAANPLSTFSIDVDAASYSNIRRFLSRGAAPPPDAVRIEEMINYFHYDYPDPRAGRPFSVTTELAACPWNPRHRLVLIGLQGERIPVEDLPPSNLVFLLDVSGSMNSADKLPLVKSAFRLLANQLRPQDRVAIVVYAGAAGLVLPSTPGSRKAEILDAIDRLEAGGSTAGGAGIRLAYEVARRNFLPGGNNRVILATDGDFNVGVSSDAELIRLIEEKRREGAFLTVLGFGTGNLQDAKMEQLADKGNGNYAYVDNLNEARKVFVQELGATLLTIAKDVKLQIEFNPARVAAYRLIGYENRLLRKEDFNDDTKDAGELGAGHAVTALYEVVPAGQPLDVEVGRVDSLKYQGPGVTPAARNSRDLLTLKLRYKPPADSVSRLMVTTLQDRVRPASRNLRFASAVAAFGMILRNSEHRGSADPDMVLDLARHAGGADPGGYRAEFIGLVESYRRLRLTAARE